MKLKKAIFFLMALSMIWIAASPALEASAQVNSPDALTLNSVYVSTPPVLDGSLNFGEWNYSANIPFHDGNISVVNDSTRLYVLVDVTGETINDPSDYFWVTFDTNQNKAIDANKDINYGLQPGTRNIRYQFYLGPGSWTGLQPSTYSARANGFGCFWADGSFGLISFFPLRISCNQHRVWELAFDLSEIGTFAGGTAKMGVRVAAAGKPAIVDDTPGNFYNDFTNLILINLAKGPLTLAPFQNSHVSFNQSVQPLVRPIEVTQAVQNPDDALKLVANKDTVARVSTISPGGAEAAKTYLYGSVGGTDLPGSPMVVYQTAPTSYIRTSLNNTANFLLPNSWTGAATVDFSASAVGLNGAGDHASTSTIPLAFYNQPTLTIWIVPVNTGSVGSPVLPPQSEINRQESYMRTVYPVSNITFVQKPWQVLGVVTGEPITALNTYYNNVVFAWIITILFNGGISPFTLPDEIYGFTPSGGGLSDPIWAGGGGHVARGFQGTSLEGTMAHETNHNLDKSATGTWGRHVNPGGTGCGAAGPDPNWPYSNPDINSIGFDTRLPWSPGVTHDTVIPGTIPDFMSYCQSGILPTKWISDYRWTNLFNNVASAGAASAAMLAPNAVISYPPHYYVTGSVSKDPTNGNLTGTLDPILVQPGITELPPRSDSDNMEINFYGSQGTIIGSVPFFADFTPDPEEPINTVYFNFSIPQIIDPTSQQPAVITKVTLTDIPVIGLAPTADLSTINVASTPLTVGITAPATTGLTWSGTQNLTWTTNNDFTKDTFNVLFSNDTGVTWTTLASGLHGVNSYAVDTTALPNTLNPDFARFQVVGTDGFNNASATSPDVTIFNTGSKPTVDITAPLPQDSVSSNPTVNLQGTGSDPTDGVLPDDHLYWYDGADKPGNELGNGASINVNLSVGVHTIILDGVNTQGNHSTATIQIVIGNPVFLPTISK